MNMLISVDNVKVTLRGAKALDGVTFYLEEGGHTALVGPNGSGKSTFLRLLRGEIWPDQREGGSIKWHTPQGPDSSPLAGRAMCALFSSAQQQLYTRQRHDIAARDLILAGLSDSHLLYTAPTEEARRRLEETAAEMRIEHLLKRRLPSLSHGQMRIVLLAKAIIRRPKVLLLDECAEGLDQTSRACLYDLLTRMPPETTILSASHRHEELPFIRHTQYMADGKFLATPANIEPEPAAKSANAATLAKPAADVAGTPLVEIRNSTIYVEREPVLHNINWSIRGGEHWLLLGPNGAGKSTLLRLLAGYEYPAAGGGIKRFLGKSGHEPDITEIRRNIRLVSDMIETDYDYDLSVKEIVLSGFEGAVGIYREYSPEEHREAERAMKLMSISDISGQLLSTLSTGQMRRAFLARAMVGKPLMILLDEPFAGLDHASAHAFMQTIGQLASGEQAVTFVLASHFAEDFHPAFNCRAIMEKGYLRI